MLNGVVLDSFALLAYLEEEQGARQVKGLLHQAVAGKLEVHMTYVNLGEAYYITARTYGGERAEEALTMIGYLPVRMVAADRKLTMAAARIKAKYPVSYADAFAVALAKLKRVPVLTGDPEFRRVEELVSVMWLEKA